MPKGCLIVPYRNREEHLKQFVPHYQSVVPEFDIYVIEQSDKKPFNRAKLLNIGFLEVGRGYDYAAYHDVDMLIENGSIADYPYIEHPLHLAGECSQFNYKMPYPTYFGGVLLLTTKHMYTTNGYSNSFWGWGGEDDEMYRRVQAKGLTPLFRNNRYQSLVHSHNYVPHLQQANHRILRKPINLDDGLSNCKYQLLGISKENGYTHVKVYL